MSKIWTCKIGEAREDVLPDGADGAMRNAVVEAYRRMTGCEPDFIFSGWGGELSEVERAAAADDDAMEETKNA